MSWSGVKSVLTGRFGPDYVLCEDCATLAERIVNDARRRDRDSMEIRGEHFAKKQCSTPGCGEPLPRRLRGKWPPPIVIPSTR